MSIEFLFDSTTKLQLDDATASEDGYALRFNLRSKKVFVEPGHGGNEDLLFELSFSKPEGETREFLHGSEDEWIWPLPPCTGKALLLWAEERRGMFESIANGDALPSVHGQLQQELFEAGLAGRPRAEDALPLEFYCELLECYEAPLSAEDVEHVAKEAMRFASVDGKRIELAETSEWVKSVSNSAAFEAHVRASQLPGTVTRDTPKVGRNEQCPCGSGKKYKRCCSE